MINWIKCSERMPDHTGEVLVFHKDGFPFCAEKALDENDKYVWLNMLSDMDQYEVTQISDTSHWGEINEPSY